MDLKEKLIQAAKYAFVSGVPFVRHFTLRVSINGIIVTVWGNMEGEGKPERQEKLVTWIEIETAVGNPLIAAIAELDSMPSISSLLGEEG